MSDFLTALRSLLVWEVGVIAIPCVVVVAWVLIAEHRTRREWREVEERAQQQRVANHMAALERRKQAVKARQKFEASPANQYKPADWFRGDKEAS